MAKILSYGNGGSTSSKEGILKSLWGSFNSLDKFIKFYVVFGILMAVATPALISGYLIFTPHAATSVAADSDNDGFSDELEVYLGTNPLKKCTNSDIFPGVPNYSWPADVKVDHKIDKQDAEAFTPYFGKRTNDSGFNVRYDLNKDGLINGRDVLTLNKYMGQTCTPEQDPPNPKPIKPNLAVERRCENGVSSANVKWENSVSCSPPGYSPTQGYRIYELNSGTWSMIKEVPSSTSSFIYTPLTPNRTYTLRVVGYNSAGESEPSNQVVFTPFVCQSGNNPIEISIFPPNTCIN